MVSRNKVEFLDLKAKAIGRFDLILKIKNVEKHFDVDIIDRDEIFGVDFPSELHVILREFPFSHKDIVKAVKPVYEELFSNQLQAA